jgi:LytS/YehU family sensor histidine kinase
LISLREELTLLESYTYIEKTRFSDDLRIDWEINPAAETRQVPNMILQPLVENAIRHGFGPANLNLRIVIRARVQDDGQLRLEVCDNGRGPNFPVQEGAGLRITRQRLQALYGDEAALILRDQHPGLCCILLIPPPPETT